MRRIRVTCAQDDQAGVGTQHLHASLAVVGLQRRSSGFDHDRVGPGCGANPRARVTLNQLSELTRSICVWAETDAELFGVGPNLLLGSFRLVAPRTFSAPDLLDAPLLQLSVSVHHLRRLLREEDTTVSDLRRDLMRDTAINSLVIGKESIDKLSARSRRSRAALFRRLSK